MAMGICKTCKKKEMVGANGMCKDCAAKAKKGKKK